MNKLHCIKNRNPVIPKQLYLLTVLLCASLVGCSNRLALEPAKQDLLLDANKRPMVLAAAKEMKNGSIVTDADVYVVEESPVMDKIDRKRTILRSKLEAVGKIVKKGLPAGDFVYADQLSFVDRPQKEDQWLFSFPNNILEKNVGKKITLKGELFQGSDKSFRLLSYDSTGRILIVGKLAEGSAQPNKCVFATGVLRRVPPVKNAPLLLYGFDAETTSITPSNW
ncbi:MAG: hypothetical protein C0507_10730 [Cyanobacteria bacterium PR.3.49]|nr:hypothetical protein [Cyanobacteria bacterium PR.3.49]